MAQVLDLDRLLADEYVAGLGDLAMADLRARKAECGEVESALSYLRRLVQGRLDIVLAELNRRTEGGNGELSDIVESLPRILSEERGRNVAGRLPTVDLPDVNHRLLTADLDRIIDIDKMGALAEMDESQLRGVADALVELEKLVSSQRRALHERLDLLQGEVVRRYKSGEASVDTLLA